MARDETKRDKSKDVWLTAFDVTQQFPTIRAAYLPHDGTSDESAAMQGYERYVPYDQLATEYERGKLDMLNECGGRIAEAELRLQAAEKRIAKMVGDMEYMRQMWEPLRQWSQSETDAGRAALGESCFATALKRIYAQEKRIAELKQELTLAQRANNWHHMPIDGFSSEHTRLKP